MNVYDSPYIPGVKPRPCPPPGPHHDPFHHDPCCEPPHHCLPPHHCEPPYGLINHYNKVCFKNYDEAVYKLKVKSLLPGEIAFAYYFDKNAEYGINAIAAVGSIKIGATNIIYDNANDIQSLIESLSTKVDSNNEKFETIVDQFDDINNVIKDISSRLHEAEDKNDSSNIESSISDIDNKIDNIIQDNASLNERIDTLDSQMDQVTDYIAQHELDYQALDASVKQLRVDVDSLGLDSKLDELVKKINQTKEDILLETKTDDASLEAKLTKEFDGKLQDYSDSLDNLKVEITQQITYTVDPLKTDIYDLQVKTTELETNIGKVKDEAVTASKEYTDNQISDQMQGINSSLTDMSNTIHDLSDLITNVSTNADNERKELKQYIDQVKSDVEGENTQFKSEVNSEINKQKQYITDTINGFKAEYTATTDKTIDEKVKVVSDKLDNYINESTTKHSEIEAKISTIKTDFATYKGDLNETIANKIAEQNTSMRNYLDTTISTDRSYYDSLYARKDQIPVNVVSGAGVTVENGVVNLNVDSNGVLTVGGKRYQLQQLN